MQHATTSERTTPWQKAAAVVMAVVLALGLTPGFGTAQAIADEGNLAAASIGTLDNETTVTIVSGEYSTYAKRCWIQCCERSLSVSQILYTADAIKTANNNVAPSGAIKSLAFNVVTAGAVEGPVQIWLATTDSSTITSAVSADQFTKVYESNGRVLGANTGWETIDFDTTFDYDGKNLIVAFCRNSSSTSNCILQQSLFSSNQAYVKDFASKWDSNLNSLSDYLNGSGSQDSDAQKRIPSIQLTFVSSDGGAQTETTVDATVTVKNAEGETVNDATVTVSDGANTIEPTNDKYTLTVGTEYTVTATKDDLSGKTVIKPTAETTNIDVTLSDDKFDKTVENAIIKTQNDMDAFVAAVNDGTLQSKTVTVDDDAIAEFAVSTSIGTSDHPFVGTFNGKWRNFALSIEKTGYSDGAQGLFGYVEGTSASPSKIENLTTTGSVKGYGPVGGVIGKSVNSVVVKKIGNNANVTATIAQGYGSSCAGGLIGRIGGSAPNLSIESSYNKGTVSGSSNIAGGLVGYLDYDDSYNPSVASIASSYNRGNISSYSYVGGLVGRSYATLNVSNCYNAAEVTATASYAPESGAIYGAVDSQYGGPTTILSSYYDSDVCTAAQTADGLTASGTSTIKNLASTLGSAFQDDLADDKALNNGYPILKWEAGEDEPEPPTDAYTITGNGELSDGAYTLTGGTYTISPATADENATVTVTATPDTENGYRLKSIAAEYRLDGYDYDATVTIEGTTGTFTMPAANATVTVTFEQVFGIAANDATPAGAGTYKVTKQGSTTEITEQVVGESVYIIATPASSAYVFDSVTVKDSSNKPVSLGTYTVNGVDAYFTMPASPVTIDVAFRSASEKTLNLSVLAQGSSEREYTQEDGTTSLNVNLAGLTKSDGTAVTADDAATLVMQWYKKGPGDSEFKAIADANASGTARWNGTEGKIKENDTENGYYYSASLSEPGAFEYKCVATWTVAGYATKTAESGVIKVVVNEKDASGLVTEIGTPAQLKAFAASVNRGDDYSESTVKLTKDIDMAGESAWAPIGTADHPFTGTFDGQKHAIKNMVITDTTTGDNSVFGLFGFVFANATIENLTLDSSCSLTSSANTVAGIVARSVQDPEKGFGANATPAKTPVIQNVRNLAAVTSTATPSTPSKASDDQNMYSYNAVAGIVGSGIANVSSCANKGAISAASANVRTAGIYGSMSSQASSVANCYNLGIVSNSAAGAPIVGGICTIAMTKTTSNVSNCYNAGAVSAASATNSDDVVAIMAGGNSYAGSSAPTDSFYLEGSAAKALGAHINAGTVTAKSSTDLKALYTTLGDANWQDGAEANKSFDEYPALIWEESALPAVTYTVKFVNDDDTQISSAEYGEGTKASAITVPTDPTKEATAEYTYVFDGWDPAVADVMADATYKAKYKATKNKYNVTFMNGETELSKTAYEYGTEAASITTPADPTKAATAEYTYEFEGWKPAIEKVTADATYTAIYRTISKETAATGVEATGDIFASVNAGESMELIVKDTTDQDESTLAAEYAEQIGTNEVAAVYEVDLVKHKTGQADEEITTGVGNLTLTFPLEDVEDGTQVKVLQLHEVTVAGQSEPQVQVYSYNGTVQDGAVTITLNGLLSKFIITVVSDEEPVATTYAVTFESNGGSAVAKQTVEAGAKATKPADPTRTGYTFGGWYADKELKTAYDFSKAVSADTTLYAKWTASEKDNETVETVTLYRLYNPNSGEHLFTTDKNEFDTLPSYGWKQEGTAWKAPKTSSTPVYRLYNPNSGDHHYTMDANEYSELAKIGWKQEGTAWYSDDAKGVGLYRLFNPNATIGTHHYTLDENEYNTLGRIGWEQEGTCWYGVK